LSIFLAYTAKEEPGTMEDAKALGIVLLKQNGE
jgi:hypothetical protein